MKRELKFRAWDGKNMIIFDNFEFQNTNGFWGGNREVWAMQSFFCIGKSKGAGYFHSDFAENIDLKPMQFTGLKDKNGKEIYEEDIVNDEELGKGIVIFQSGCFFMMYDAETNMEFLGIKTDRFGRLQEKRIVEIIGNIYENPELTIK